MITIYLGARRGGGGVGSFWRESSTPSNTLDRTLGIVNKAIRYSVNVGIDYSHECRNPSRNFSYIESSFTYFLSLNCCFKLSP